METNACETVEELIEVLKTMNPKARIEGAWEGISRCVADVLELRNPHICMFDGKEIHYPGVVYLDVDGSTPSERKYYKPEDNLAPPVPREKKLEPRN